MGSTCYINSATNRPRNTSFESKLANMLSPRTLSRAASDAAILAGPKEIPGPFKTYVAIQEAAVATAGTCRTPLDFLDLLDTFTVSLRQGIRHDPYYKRLDFKELEKETSSCEDQCNRNIELLKHLLTILRKAEVRKRELAPFAVFELEGTVDAAKKMIGLIDHLWERLMEIERQWKELNDW